MNDGIAIWNDGVAGWASTEEEDGMIDIEIGIVEPRLRLRVPASQDSLPLVRQALRSLGETVDADLEALEDAELAVTEAMANAVEHAYADGDGEVRVEFDPRDNDLVVLVSDDGSGIPEEEADSRKEGRGFGLSMIEGIATKMDIRGGDGTDVEMTFAIGHSEIGTVDGGIPGVEPAERILRRLVAIVAAQLDMPSDRVVEALLVSELVARNALRHLTGDRVEVGITEAGEGFELRVGPLEKNGARAVVADSDVPVVGPVIERLADEIEVERRDDDAEHLVLRMAPR